MPGDCHHLEREDFLRSTLNSRPVLTGLLVTSYPPQEVWARSPLTHDALVFPLGLPSLCMEEEVCSGL